MKIFALVEAADSPSARYRLRPFFARARDDGWYCETAALPRAHGDRKALFRRAAEADVCVLQRRLLGWAGRRRLFATMSAAGTPVVYDVDDALWLPDSFSGRGRSRTRGRRWTATVSACAAVLAGNAALADKARARCGRVTVIPTCVTPPHPGPRDAGFAGQPKTRFPTAVWIGSSSTLGYLEAAAPALQETARRVPGFRLRVIADRRPELPGIDVDFRPWSAGTEWGDLATAHVGLGPLPDDPWARGKCGLKLLQYAAAGLPSVAAPTGVQSEQVKDGETGCLAAGHEAFAEALVGILGDPARGRVLGEAALAGVRERWSHQAWYGRWKAAIQAAV